jgi:hypothetical protein
MGTARPDVNVKISKNMASKILSRFSLFVVDNKLDGSNIHAVKDATNTEPGETMNTRKAEWQIENSRLLEKLGGKVRDFNGWKAVGKFVKRGEKQRAYRVQAGVVRTGINPITGEDRYEPNMKICYGFHESQVS